MKNQQVIFGVLLMMLCIQHCFCGDYLYMNFDTDKPTPNRRQYKIEAEFNADNTIGLQVHYFDEPAKNHYEYYVDGFLGYASTYNSHDLGWMSVMNEGTSPFLRLQHRLANVAKYTFELEDAIVKGTESLWIARSPCKTIVQTNEALCLLRLTTQLKNSVKSWMPFYIKVKDFTDMQRRTLKLLGGSYKTFNRSISNQDVVVSDALTQELSFSMANVTTASNPNRTVILNGVNARTSQVLGQIKPKYMFFRCPTFEKFVPFTREEVLQQNITINLAQLGLPFDTNMLCSYSVFFTDRHNEMYLVRINGKDVFSVRNSTEVEEFDLKSEYNKLAMKYNDVVKTLQSLIPLNPVSPVQRMLVSRRNGMMRSLASKVFGRRQ